MKHAPLALFAALSLATPAWAAEPEKTTAPKDSKELVKPNDPSADASKDKPSSDKPAYVIKVDVSEAPEMADFAKRVQQVSDEWYPKLIPMLPSEGFKPAQTVTITIKKDYKGVAAAGGNRITASQAYFTKNPNDLGAFVHELVHVVQSYGRSRAPGATRPPGWLVEGIADYIRFYRYEPESARPKPNPARAKYSDSYRTTGHFLNWAQEKYDKDLVVKLNAACRQGKFSEDLWKQYTGKTVEELGAEWKESLPKPQPKK